MKPSIPIGFLSNQELARQAVQRQICGNDIFLRFDSGRLITFADAVHHLLTLGSTGCGKSQTVMYPALLRLMSEGSFGLIIDIKGNMRSNVRALARTCGREGDIIEYGTSPTATPLNLLDGMERHQLRQFFEQLTLQNFMGASQSVDWHMKGVAIATDCAQLLQFLAEKYPNFVLNCRLVHEMVSEPVEAAKLFEFFKNKVFDPERPDHKQLVSAVENNRFHALRKIKVAGQSESTRDEQMTWALQGVRDGLRSFLDAPGIERNFCRPGAQALELAKPMAEGKIVILRFDLDTGPVGAKLARTLISHFYSRIFQLGLSLCKARKSFICIDEFQEVADLSNGRFSDSSFIAMAREFGCIFMAATQSLSALMSKGEASAAVMAFASNCNQKIVFYSDDPLTQELAARHDPDVNLTDFKPGEAFVTTYEHETRKHAHGVETLNESYASVKEILASVPSEPLMARDEGQSSTCSLGSLVTWVENEGKRKSEVTDQQKIKTGEKIISKSEVRIKMQENVKALIDKFPELFEVVENSEFCLPVGWVAYVEKAVSAFKAAGVPARIVAIRIDNGILHALDSGESRASGSAGVKLLNSFLHGAQKLCVLCGKQLSDRELGQYHGRMGTCSQCLKKFGLLSPDMASLDNGEDDFPHGKLADSDPWR